METQPMTEPMEQGPNENIFREFLERQYAEGMALAGQSDILKLIPMGGSPPQSYIAEFACKGLVQNEKGEIVEFDRFAAAIAFPDDYLRRLDHHFPVAAYLGPHPRPWHPNLRGPYICIDIKPGTELVPILYGLFELFSWRLMNLADNGLNLAATQWARAQDPKRFPLDRRPLKRRKLQLEVSQPTTEAGK